MKKVFLQIMLLTICFLHGFICEAGNKQHSSQRTPGERLHCVTCKGKNKAEQYANCLYTLKPGCCGECKGNSKEEKITEASKMFDVTGSTYDTISGSSWTPGKGFQCVSCGSTPQESRENCLYNIKPGCCGGCKGSNEATLPGGGSIKTTCAVCTNKTKKDPAYLNEQYANCLYDIKPGCCGECKSDSKAYKTTSILAQAQNAG